LHEEAADKRDKPVHMFPSRLAKMGFWVVLSLRFPRKIEVARFNKGVTMFFGSACGSLHNQPATQTRRRRKNTFTHTVGWLLLCIGTSLQQQL
jgi:hypothetical protein